MGAAGSRFCHSVALNVKGPADEPAPDYGAPSLPGPPPRLAKASPSPRCLAPQAAQPLRPHCARSPHAVLRRRLPCCSRAKEDSSAAGADFVDHVELAVRIRPSRRHSLVTTALQPRAAALQAAKDKQSESELALITYMQSLSREESTELSSSVGSAPFVLHGAESPDAHLRRGGTAWHCRSKSSGRARDRR